MNKEITIEIDLVKDIPPHLPVYVHDMLILDKLRKAGVPIYGPSLVTDLSFGYLTISTPYRGSTIRKYTWHDS